MKTAYLSMDMFWGLFDNVRCSEARLVIEKMMGVIEGLRQCAEDESCETEEMREAYNFSADCIQEALEDYLCAHAKHRDMMDRPLKNPFAN